MYKTVKFESQDMNESISNNLLVSIVVPSYNHEKFITRCIESIFSQTYRNFELIVIDDGSTDSSRDILNELKNKYQFTLVFQENCGLSETFNRAIKQYSSGDYFTFCASDDYWLPYKLEMQMAYMVNNPGVPMCYGKAYVVDEEDNILESLTIERNKNLKGGFIFEEILLREIHPPVNYLFKKSIFEDVGYYREDILTEDFYMNLKISNKYKIGYIDEYLFCYRAATNYSRKFINNKSALSHLECISEYKSSPAYDEAIQRWNYRSFIWYSPYKQHKVFAFMAMLKSMRYLFSVPYAKAMVKLIFIWR